MSNYTLSGIEVNTLLFHMQVMRVTMKKGLKRNYGLFGSRKLIQSYDGIMDKLKDLMAQESDINLLNLEHKENEMYKDFLTWYVQQLEEDLKGQDLDKEQEEGLNIIRKLVNDLLKTA